MRGLFNSLRSLFGREAAQQWQARADEINHLIEQARAGTHVKVSDEQFEAMVQMFGLQRAQEIRDEIEKDNITQERNLDMSLVKRFADMPPKQKENELRDLGDALNQLRAELGVTNDELKDLILRALPSETTSEEIAEQTLADLRSKREQATFGLKGQRGLTAQQRAKCKADAIAFAGRPLTQDEERRLDAAIEKHLDKEEQLREIEDLDVDRAVAGVPITREIVLDPLTNSYQVGERVKSSDLAEKTLRKMKTRVGRV